MAKACRPLIAALALSGWAAVVPGHAEIVVTSGEPVGIPLVIHGASALEPPVVVLVPQGPLFGQFPAAGTTNYGTLRTNQSNLDQLLRRTDRLRGIPDGAGRQTIILLSK